MANRKRLTAVVAVVMAVALALSVTACGGGDGGATAVVKDYFDAIDKHDAKKFLNCYDKDDRENLLDYYDEDEIKDQLEVLDELFENFAGKNWRKEVKIGKAKKVDENKGIIYYEVEVELDGEEDYIEVKKVKGKYYISNGIF